MQTVTDNTTAQINAALIALEEEIKALKTEIASLKSSS
jgi:hypothetical protein